MGRTSMPQGRGSLMHNRREYEKYGKPVPSHIDQSRMHENVVLVDRDIRKAYKEIFGEALDAHDAKQTRKDRRINDYYDHISKSKNGEKLFYEDVVQWGDKSDFENNPRNREIAKQCLIEYVEGFKEANPQLEIIGAYIHMDEASPHLHLDYVPVATGYKRGLSKRNSLDKAMKQMGYTPKGKEGKLNNATKMWKESERKRFGDICRAHGLAVEDERHWGRKSLSVDEYKVAKDKMMGYIEKERYKAFKDVSALKRQAKALDGEIEAKKAESGYISAATDESLFGRVMQFLTELLGLVREEKGDDEFNRFLESNFGADLLDLIIDLVQTFIAYERSAGMTIDHNFDAKNE